MPTLNRAAIEAALQRFRRASIEGVHRTEEVSLVRRRRALMSAKFDGDDSTREGNALRNESPRTQ